MMYYVMHVCISQGLLVEMDSESYKMVLILHDPYFTNLYEKKKISVGPL